MTEVAVLGTSLTEYKVDYATRTLFFADNMAGYAIEYTYLSNALTTDESAAIPKLAEEALYACMIYSIMANRDNPDPNMLQRLLISKIALLDLSKSRLVFTNFT
jgi:trans-2-enoyl-CoA reductase